MSLNTNIKCFILAVNNSALNKDIRLPCNSYSQEILADGLNLENIEISDLIFQLNKLVNPILQVNCSQVSSTSAASSSSQFYTL